MVVSGNKPLVRYGPTSVVEGHMMSSFVDMGQSYLFQLGEVQFRSQSLIIKLIELQVTEEINNIELASGLERELGTMELQMPPQNASRKRYTNLNSESKPIEHDSTRQATEVPYEIHAACQCKNCSGKEEHCAERKHK